jgi:membrane carboxypeptidase/penicillin-binding protein
MVDMMRTVVQAGTGRRLIYEFGAGGMEVGGKTGTSQENRDGWFMCVAPNLVGGVWVGGENQSIHLSRAGEGSVVALPIYGEFLRSVLKDGNLGVTRSDRFHNPPGAKNYTCWEPESPYNDDAVYAEMGEEGGEIDWDAEYRSNLGDFDVDSNIDVDTYKKQKKEEKKAQEEAATMAGGGQSAAGDGATEKPAKQTPAASVVYEEEEEFF